MSTLTAALHPLTLAAHVVAKVIHPAPPRHHPDWEIAQYGTKTFRDGELVAETPEVTYGELRGRA